MPLTEIRVWQSYSCNNSSSYHLVAKFSDGKVVKDVAKELAAFFKEHAEEQDSYFDENDEYMYSSPSKTSVEFGKKNGFTWKSSMYWGDEMQVGDEPEIFTEGDALILYHGYCGGGLPKEVDKYLELKGGTIGKPPKNIDDRFYVSVRARLPKAGAKSPLKKELDEFYSVMEEDDSGRMPGNPPPWKGREAYGMASYFCDGKTIGFFVPSEPGDLDTLKKWLQKKGAIDPVIRINEWSDFDKFKAIAEARCTECDGALEYLDPRITKIDSDQLACAKCGGMFDLSTFMGKKKKKKPEEASKPGAVAPKKKKAAAKKTKAPAKKKKAAAKKKKKAAAKKPK